MTFTYLFYKHIMFRHSCGNCHFCNTHRPSDITLADFWGWQNSVPGMNDDDKGVSLVLLNTDKGKEIFEAIQEKLDVREVKLDNCLQPNLRHPTVIHPQRFNFERDYRKRGFEYLVKRYGEDGWRYKLEVLKKRVKKILRKVV